MLRCAIF